MKLNKYSAIVFASILLNTGCTKDFLNRTPKTNVTDQTFFKTPEDLKTYTNGFYTMIEATYHDLYSDNIGGFTGSNTNNNMLRGNLSQDNIGGWTSDWAAIRRINHMLDNMKSVTGDQGDIKHYEGIARFFRAYNYINLVKSYHNVPWYDHVLSAESEDLYKAQDTREFVVSKIMEDLEFASKNIKASAKKDQINKWVALNLLSRFSLYEGTFRKYHDEVNLKGSANEFLQKSIDASQEIMEKGGFQIYNTNAKGLDFRALFTSTNLSSNPEMLFIQKNDRALGISNNTHTVLDWQWALSGQLMEEFLMADGTPFTDQQNYQSHTFHDVFKYRDVRLAETIMPANFKTNPSNPKAYLPRPNFGGYLQVKFYPRDPNLRAGWGANFTDLPIMRYAEVLLNYAEAKAELGQLTQVDIDKSINKLRTRVGLPGLDLAKYNSLVDPFLQKRYPNVQSSQKSLVLEVRRERRTELACEGFRFDDLMRWKVGELLADQSRGMYVEKLGALDVNNDGEFEMAILKDPKDLSPIKNLSESEQKALTKFYLSEGSFYLSNGESGYVMLGQDKKLPKKFISPKYYYKPIPRGQLVLNPKLKQVFNWDE